MFDRNKQADEASAASAQGIERKGNEDSLRQESNSGLSIQGPEAARPGLPIMQNRQGYCSCCHVHYSNLEQHVYSSQHRHFTTHCRNRTGTTSLMERFLQDVLQHHPYSYHDNRPTYDDMPFTSSQLPGDEALLSLDVVEKERTASRGEERSTDSGFTAESGCLVSQRSQDERKKVSMAVTPHQKLEGGQEHSPGASEKPLAVSCNTKDTVPMEGALSESSNHQASFTAVNLLPDPVPVCHSPSAPHRLQKNTRYPIVPESFSIIRCEQSKPEICNEDEVLNPNLSAILQSTESKTVLLSQESPVFNQGSSLISGQLLLKQDSLQPQDETPISDFSLRNTNNPLGTSSSWAFQADSQVSGKKEIKLGETVGETPEEVLLKYCDKTAPNELPSRDEDTNSCVNILSLLDHSSAQGSDISFDCDAAVPAVQSGTTLPKATVKNLELLKEVQVDLQDENYGTQLSSILKSGSVQQEAEADKDVSTQNKEPVLPALPHVPPSFVGKTWSQIMYEDDMKIEALVRDFREGRFRCHFDTESLANCAKRRARKKKQQEGGISANAANKTEVVSVKGLPEFTDALSVASDFSNSSVISETQPIPETSKRPKKRTWRLASRCQVVKVSHGTQTSLIHYPVVKQKIIRKDCEPPDQKGSPVWSENEKTPTMKTRLCALKLPESYTKIMSPVQPQTVVYVLSCPEIKQFRSKVEDIPKMRRNQHSTDSKDSVRYKYKQSSIRYYDPLTNRVLKTPPKSMAGEKSRNPPHIRQLFRSLNVDANQKKQTDSECECIMPKSFNSTDFHSSSASFLLHPIKENDMSSSHKTDGSSVSTESSECLVCNNSEKSYKNVVLSPLNSHQSQREGDFRLTPLKSRVADCLERDNPKTKWQRKKGSSREPGVSKKASGLALVRRRLIRRGSRKQSSRTIAQQKRGRTRRISPCTLKSSASSTPRHQTKKTSIGKHLKKEKLDAKKLKVTRKSKRTFLNPATIMGIPEKRQRVTARLSSKIKKWEGREGEMRVSFAL